MRMSDTTTSNGSAVRAERVGRVHHDVEEHLVHVTGVAHVASRHGRAGGEQAHRGSPLAHRGGDGATDVQVVAQALAHGHFVVDDQDRCARAGTVEVGA
jgi:hypothetical protein